MQTFNQVYEAKTLTIDNILGVLDGKYPVIRIPSFHNKNICTEITQKLFFNSEQSTNGNKSQILDPNSLNRINSKSPMEGNADAIHRIHQLRRNCQPYLSPIDHFRLLLDEIWPAVAQLETIQGKKCSAGLYRIIEEGLDPVPYLDKISRKGLFDGAHSLLQQLVVHIFIATPKEGGEIEIWSEESEVEVFRQKIGRIPQRLPSPSRTPDIILRPQTGDLILFRSDYYLGARKSVGGYRASITAFVGYRGKKQPLTIWS